MMYLGPMPRHQWPAVPATMSKVCDNESVGVLVVDQDDRLLMFRRMTAPIGMAPPAGHVDDHGSRTQAAVDEVAEEVGLTVAALRPVVPMRWLPNICRRQHGPCGPGHNWAVYEAVTYGEVTLGEREAADAAWHTPTQVAQLAARTVAYGRGELTDAQWAGSPGLEPVWCWLLAASCRLRLSLPDLDVAADLFSRSPYEQVTR